MKTKELIDYINNADDLYCLHEIEDLNINGEYPELLVAGLNLDELRWYSTAENYYKCEDGIVGVFGAYQSFSEMQMWSDIDIHCEAFEGEEYTTVSYREKR